LLHRPSPLVEEAAELASEGGPGQRKEAGRDRDEAAGDPPCVANHPRLGSGPLVEHEGSEPGPIRTQAPPRVGAVDPAIHRVVEEGLRQHFEQRASFARGGTIRSGARHRAGAYLGAA
jgi:hypothetical protein